MKKSMKAIALVLIGMLIVFGIYLFGYTQASIQYLPPHFHANFAMYIDGERVDFSLDDYMEDVAGCSLNGKILPKDRVHLHENNGETIHIHADGVSWGHFFSNNRFLFSDNFIQNDTGEIFLNSENSKISFILNGEKIKNPFNKLINSEDRLLINFGTETEQELQEYFMNVSNNAGEYNGKYDPGSCGGTNENGVIVIFRDRLTAIFGQHAH